MNKQKNNIAAWEKQSKAGKHGLSEISKTQRSECESLVHDA